MISLEKHFVEALGKHLTSGEPPAVPDLGRDLWAIFIGVARSRTYHAAGPNPISYAEIEAYCRLYRWPLEPHHIDVLTAMDDAWLTHAYGQMKARQDGTSAPVRLPAKALTADLFDAVMM